jgi:multicomponent Na+:H+ antiporter subunit C
MHLLTAILVGIIFGCATYLILQKSFVKILFGFGLLTHGANLLILSLSKNPTDKLAPIITDLSKPYVDPVPQALILTAIVIGFGITAYMVVLLYRLYKVTGKTSIEDL